MRYVEKLTFVYLKFKFNRASVFLFAKAGNLKWEKEILVENGS